MARTLPWLPTRRYLHAINHQNPQKSSKLWYLPRRLQEPRAHSVFAADPAIPIARRLDCEHKTMVCAENNEFCRKSMNSAEKNTQFNRKPRIEQKTQNLSPDHPPGGADSTAGRGAAKQSSFCDHREGIALPSRTILDCIPEIICKKF